MGTRRGIKQGRSVQIVIGYITGGVEERRSEKSLNRALFVI